MDPALQRLLDENAIRALAAHYSDAVTHLDAARAAALYAEDATIDIAGNTITGRAAIEAGMRASFAAFSLLQLIEHAGVITIDGDRATARWSTIELAVRTGSQAMSVIFGRYEDTLARTPTGWHFTHRCFTLAGRTRLETSKLELGTEFHQIIDKK